MSYSWFVLAAPPDSRAQGSWLAHFRNLITLNWNWHCHRRWKMITVPDPVERLSFCSEGWLREMASGWMETRKARLSAVCALVLGCVVASAAQDAPAPSSTATKKPSTTKTAPKHHSTSSTTTSKSNTAKTSSTKTSSGKTHTASSGKHSHKKSAKVRGQQKIDSERAQSIQEALIREHYLSGEAT